MLGKKCIFLKIPDQTRQGSQRHPPEGRYSGEPGGGQVKSHPLLEIAVQFQVAISGGEDISLTDRRPG